MRLTVKATCPMDLTYFPMDSQMCTLEIESYGYTMDDMVYVWKEDQRSVEVSPDVALTEFYVVGYRQRRVLEVLTSGNYSRLCADIQFSRSTGYYIIQVGFLVWTLIETLALTLVIITPNLTLHFNHLFEMLK